VRERERERERERASPYVVASSALEGSSSVRKWDFMCVLSIKEVNL
jgi:hypothetical protein